MNNVKTVLRYVDYVKGVWGLSQLPYFTFFKVDGGRYDLATALPTAQLQDE